jgi:nucleoside-diphosphate-sugar epimerase
MNLVVVTGATGFIGRQLCRELSARGRCVRAVVRAAPNTPIDVSQTAIVGEIGPLTDWARALDGAESVVHLAGVAHRLDEAVDAAEHNRVNHLGTARLAEAVAASSTVRRLIYISSLAVIGSRSDVPVDETTLARPDTPYGTSKRDAELALQRALSGADTTKDWCILRPPLVYGPGNPGNMERLLRLVERSLPLPLAGIENQRSFLFVGNLVDAIAVVMTDPRASRSTFFVTDGKPISTPELLRRIAQVSGRPARLFRCPQILLQMIGVGGDVLAKAGVRISFNSYALARLTDSFPVCSEAIQKALGWIPRFSMNEGLQATLEPCGRS